MRTNQEGMNSVRRGCPRHASSEVAACRLLRSIEKCGAQGRDRTADTVIFSHVLYQLSYLGMGDEIVERAYRGG